MDTALNTKRRRLHCFTFRLILW